MDIQSTTILNNGVEIPVLGLGVFRSEGDQAINAVQWALEVGYRHIDTAAVYHNEEHVREGIRRSGVDRKDIFITTKLWNEDMRQNRQREAFEESLEKLGTDYVDLYLIHWPVDGKYVESWHIMEELYNKKLIRAIGLSNFHAHHIEDVLKEASVQPVIDQIELSPRLTQVDLTAYIESCNMKVEPWSPLGGTGGNLLKDPVLTDIAKKYEKSTAQVILRWMLQKGYVLIPKSIHKEYIESNAQIFDFEISSDDAGQIDAMNMDERTGADPESFDF